MRFACCNSRLTLRRQPMPSAICTGSRADFHASSPPTPLIGGSCAADEFVDFAPERASRGAAVGVLLPELVGLHAIELVGEDKLLKKPSELDGELGQMGDGQPLDEELLLPMQRPRPSGFLFGETQSKPSDVIMK